MGTDFWWVNLILLLIGIGLMVLWGRYYFRVLEPRLRGQIGSRLGVRIRLTGRRHWEVEGRSNLWVGFQVFVWEIIVFIFGLTLPAVVGFLGVFAILFKLNGE